MADDNETDAGDVGTPELTSPRLPPATGPRRSGRDAALQAGSTPVTALRGMRAVPL
jgi:hypothetical protein